MRYEIDIPEEIDQRLSEQASATGEDVVHLMQTAIAVFVRSGMVMRSRTGRLPDSPLEQAELSTPVDLPYSGNERVLDVRTEPGSNRFPDPVTVPE